MPLISIIIPVYNAEKYIRKCLDSILAQTHTNWEAILVDDGSPDNSGAICDEYATKDSRFKVIHQENGGVVNARNKAIATANGEYISFVDSDDYIEPEMLKEMISFAKKESLDIVWCDINVILEDTVRPHHMPIAKDNDINIRNLLTMQIPGYLFNKIIRTSFWNKCNIKTDEKAVICEDSYISLQLLNNNPINGKIDKVFYNYNRLNENSATNIEKNPTIIGAIGNIYNIYNYLKEQKIINKYYCDFCVCALWLKINLLRDDVKLAKETFPFAHKRVSNFRFRFITALFYWFAFNTGIIGESILKIHIRNKSL